MWYYNKTQDKNTHITQNNTPHSDKTQPTNKGHIIHNAKKSIAIPVTGHGGIQHCEMSRIPNCLDNQFIDGTQC
jgi:hypothetical protein